MPRDVHPPLPRAERTSPERQPSLRVRVAAAMLRRGHHPGRVAEASGVPLALVEFIAEHLDPRSSTQRPSGQPTDPGDQIGPAPGATTPIPARRGVAPGCARPGVRARIVLGVVLGVLVDGGLAVAAVITHLHAVGAAVVLLSPLLIVLLVTLTAQTPRRSPRT